MAKCKAPAIAVCGAIGNALIARRLLVHTGMFPGHCKVQMSQTTLRLLRVLYVGRLTIAVGIFIAALWAWTGASADVTLVATLSLLLSLGFSAGSFWYTEVLGRRPSRDFLYGQVLFDTLLVTAIIHITSVNNTPSDFSALYVPVIALSALVLPMPGGLLIGGLASILYVADILWLQPFAISVDTLLQVGLFVVLAGVTALLGHRLRRTGTALGMAESELRQLRLDTGDILAAIDTGLVTVDHDGNLMYMNAAAQSILELRLDDWRDRPAIDALDRSAPQLGSTIARTSRTGSPVRRLEIRVPRPEGDLYLAVRTTLLDRPNSPWTTAVIQDVTEHRQIDDLIRRAERLQAVAELGASLAHEIKNPLASIRSSIEQLAKNRLGPGDRDTLQRLTLTESDRLARLLAEFMEFSRLELRRWKKIDLREVASDAVGLVAQHPDTGASTRIELDAPQEPLTVDGDQDLLHRAVFNLVLNGVQHAGPSGRVRVELGRADGFEVPASVPIESPVRITVEDSGPGIREEDIGRLFDPFFTTRNGGNGLGLAMVHRAIEAHRGAILVDGNVGRGARFTVYLPAHSNGRRN
jgi:two-component system sensor histidine kinase PilS (NtrC family)